MSSHEPFDICGASVIDIDEAAACRSRAPGKLAPSPGVLALSMADVTALGGGVTELLLEARNTRSGPLDITFRTRLPSMASRGDLACSGGYHFEADTPFLDLVADGNVEDADRIRGVVRLTMNSGAPS